MRLFLKRWFWIWLVAETPMALGYDGLGFVLLRQVGLAVSAWFFGFDFARARELRFIEDIVRREAVRLALFAIAMFAAVLVIAGGHNAAVVDAGTAILYGVMGATIARQGWRVGGRRLEGWEYRDEFLYGALGSVLVMCLAGLAVIAVGDAPGILATLLMVSPIGLIAIADEPLYPTRRRYAKRFFIRQYRRMVVGVADETW
jgi:hypothetical protein